MEKLKRNECGGTDAVSGHSLRSATYPHPSQETLFESEIRLWLENNVLLLSPDTDPQPPQPGRLIFLKRNKDRHGNSVLDVL